MLDLVKDLKNSSRNDVSFVVTENEEIITFNNDEDLFVLVDYKELEQKENYVFNFVSKHKVSIIEINNSSSKVTFNLSEYSFVNHSIAFLDEGDSSNYEVNLSLGATYEGALADFSYGNENVKVTCNLNERDSKVLWHLSSLATLDDKKEFDISINHYAPHTYAKMENYGVNENRASMNFLGVSKIHKGAKASATHQSAKIMVFDADCKAKASPSLCIDENDVEASHAAVVGQINEDHIFYLTSRGIKEEEAKKLITLGYLNPILNYFNDEQILSSIKETIDRRF